MLKYVEFFNIHADFSQKPSEIVRNSEKMCPKFSDVSCVRKLKRPKMLVINVGGTQKNVRLVSSDRPY